MADNNQASFIPKATSSRPKRSVRKTKRIYIIGYISYVFFFGTVVVVLGAYFYAIQADRVLEIKKQELLEKQSRFNDSHILYVKELEQRINKANTLMTEASAPSRLFTALEETVAQTVAYQTFAYERNDENQYIVSFEGATNSFDDAIFQREVLAENEILENAVVSEFSHGTPAEGESGETVTQPAGNVVFTYQLMLAPGTVDYDPQVYDDSRASEVVPETATTTTTATTTSTSSVSSNPVDTE